MLDSGSDNTTADDLVETLPDGVDLEFELERRELADLLGRALDLLPVETRCILIERYVHERLHAHIAETLGVSEEAVGVGAQPHERGRA